MVTDQLLTEIERQEKYLSELPDNFEFPLFNVRHAVESQRRSGYRDTAAASREIVDNAIEAGASRIDVVFDTDPGKKAINAIAFIDNASGMLPKMIRYALTWGGGTHFDDHEFIGRFGFGLPNSFWIRDPFYGGHRQGLVAKILDTHPAIERRIACLRSLEGANQI